MQYDRGTPPGQRIHVTNAGLPLFWMLQLRQAPVRVALGRLASHDEMIGAVSMPDKLHQGRQSYRRREWCTAYESLALADAAEPLGVDDLEMLATSAYLIGRDADFHTRLDRAHHAHLDAGDAARAARCAFWLGLMLFLRGEPGQASGWLARARRLVEGRDCVEQGYLLLPVAEGHLVGGDTDAANATAADAAEIGMGFQDADLIACARHLQGRALIKKEQVQAGLVLLDEAMHAVIAGELSPIMTGLIYCSLIAACQEVYASSRAREWTNALARWCEQQPQLVAFTGVCLVHRAQIMQLSGAWPGLALLRLAQGRSDAAGAGIRRVLRAATSPLHRVRFLPAYIQIMLATSETAEARVGCAELMEIANRFGTDALEAMAAHARGSVELAEGEPEAALGSLRRAFELWRQVDAPYEAARVRMLIGRACRSLGDVEASDLEFDAARAMFEELGAAPEPCDDVLGAPATPAPQHPLTPREVEVLRLIAAGKTNRSIAKDLFVSERTIDRHVSNILTKLDIPSRSAATAYAFRNKLV